MERLKELLAAERHKTTELTEALNEERERNNSSASHNLEQMKEQEADIRRLNTTVHRLKVCQLFMRFGCCGFCLCVNVWDWSATRIDWWHCVCGYQGELSKANEETRRQASELQVGSRTMSHLADVCVRVLGCWTATASRCVLCCVGVLRPCCAAQEKLRSAEAEERRATSQLRKERARVQKDLTQQAGEIQGLHDTIHALQRNVSTLTSREADLKGKLESERDAAASAAEEAAHAAQSASSRHAQAVASLERQLSEVQGQLVSTQDELATARTELAAAKRAKTAAVDKAAAAAASSAEAQADVQAELETARGETARAQKRLQHVEKTRTVRGRGGGGGGGGVAFHFSCGMDGRTVVCRRATCARGPVWWWFELVYHVWGGGGVGCAGMIMPLTVAHPPPGRQTFVGAARSPVDGTAGRPAAPTSPGAGQGAQVQATCRRRTGVADAGSGGCGGRGVRQNRKAAHAGTRGPTPGIIRRRAARGDCGRSA